MSTNRAALYGKIHKILKKHYKPATPVERSVLEHLLLACCLENSRLEAADEAFAKLQLYADWNEVRVTSVTELSEVMSMLQDSGEAARRLKRALQSVFETKYSFDLEYLKKINLGKALKELESFQGVTPFAVAYVSQHGLGGHSIPANAGVFNVLVALGGITESEAASQRIPGMERAIPKTKGIEFASLLHQLGVDFQSSPTSRLKGILHEINPETEYPKREKKPEPTSQSTSRGKSRGSAKSRAANPESGKSGQTTRGKKTAEAASKEGIKAAGDRVKDAKKAGAKDGGKGQGKDRVKQSGKATERGASKKSASKNPSSGAARPAAKPITKKKPK